MSKTWLCWAHVRRSLAFSCVWTLRSLVQGWSPFCWLKPLIFNSNPRWWFCMVQNLRFQSELKAEHSNYQKKDKKKGCVSKACSSRLDTCKYHNFFLHWSTDLRFVTGVFKHVRPPLSLSVDVENSQQFEISSNTLIVRLIMASSSTFCRCKYNFDFVNPSTIREYMATHELNKARLPYAWELNCSIMLVGVISNVDNRLRLENPLLDVGAIMGTKSSSAHHDSLQKERARGTHKPD